jgi:hypothetical protein
MILINKKHLITVAILLATIFLINGCSVRVADLTLVSTKNIDLSNAKFDANKGQRAKGEDCIVLLLGIPLGVPNLEKAIDDALEKGRGNAMVDQVTYSNFKDFIIAGQSCIEVEGTVLNTNTTDGTANKPVIKEPQTYYKTTPAMNQSAEKVSQPYYENIPATQPVPVNQPVAEDTALSYQNYQQPQSGQSGTDLRHCLSLVSNEAIAKCVRKGK